MDSIFRALMLLCLVFAQVSQAQTYEDLKEIITKNDIKSIAALLPQLPKEYRSEFTLMMKSQSLQDASVNFPRVIMAGPDGRLLLAFNGDPAQKNYDSLEIIQYRDGTASFDFFEIRFPEKDQNGNPLNNLTKAEFSGRNPSKCLACHTSDPRPNWQHYPRWPGAFLGSDDRENLEPDLPDYQTYLSRLQNEFPQHPRYKHLEKVVEGYKYDGFRHGERNIRVTERIYRLNYLRVARILKNDPYYGSYKFLMMGMLGCGRSDYQDFLPAGFTSFSEAHDEFYQSHFDDVYIKRKLYIGDLYPDFRETKPFFTVPSTVSDHLSYGFVYGDQELEPNFRLKNDAIYGGQGGSAKVRDCDLLETQSKQALANVPMPADEAQAREQAQPKILKRCMECHTSGPVGMGAPHFPLDNVLRLKTHLSVDGYPRGNFYDEVIYRISAGGTPRMPPEGMSDSDRNELTNYLRGIK